MLGVALLTGCGGSSPDRPAARATATESAVPVKVAVSITRPKPGAKLTGGDPVPVAGRAPAGTTVLLAAGCFKAGCQAIARAGRDGRWRAELTVVPPKAVIEASTPSSGTLDSVRVRVAAPALKPGVRLPTAPESEPTAAPRPVPERVHLVGDSLAVGIQDLLPGLLGGIPVTADALTGRPLAAGMAIISGLDLRSQPTALAVSLFTNDDPRNVEALEAAVRSTVAAVGSEGCAIWATIVRPPLNGVSYQAANGRLLALEAELAPRLVIVPWAEQVAADPALIASDHVHATPAGYQARAVLYAQAVQSCGG